MSDNTISLDEIINLTRKLVAFPTRNPPGEERACAEFITATLRAWGIETELIPEPYPERPQVAAWVRGTDPTAPTLTLNGHIDTVPEGDPAAWQFPPFEATVHDGKLYGLGTADMKTQLAIAMLTLKALKESGVRLRGSLMFQAVIGEELAEPGTRYLLTERKLISDYAIVLEPTNLRIAPCTRGVAWHTVTIFGVPAHCGLVDHYVNPASKFAQVCAALDDYHTKIHAQTHPLLRPPACTVTLVRAGEKHNHIPASCEFVIDRRMLPGERTAGVAVELRAILDSFAASDPDFRCEMTFLRDNEPAEIPVEHPLVQAVQKHAAEVLGRDPGIWGPPYGSDMRNFVVDAGIPAVNFGPGDFNVCHTPQEYVSLDEVQACARVVMGVILDLLT